MHPEVSKQRLLLVDGDPKSLRVLDVSLKKAGFGVNAVTNADEALLRLESEVPDLIIADTDLGEVDGFELCRRIKNRPEWAKIPFIFLSSRRSIEEKIRGLECGVEDYLIRPIYIKEIITRTRMLIQRQQRERLEARGDGRTKFVGQLAEIGIVDLVQTIEVNRKSGIIHIANREARRGSIYFREGKVIDAEVGRLSGVEALYRLFFWTDGVFEVEFKPIRRKDIIDLSSQAVLMEGMRRLDDWTHELESLPPLDTVFEVDYEILAERLGEIPDEVNAILRLFDGRRTFAQVIEDSDFPDLEALSVIAKLHRDRVVYEVARAGLRAPVVKRGDADPQRLERWLLGDDGGEPGAVSLSALDGAPSMAEEAEVEEGDSLGETAQSTPQAVVETPLEAGQDHAQEMADFAESVTAHALPDDAEPVALPDALGEKPAWESEIPALAVNGDVNPPAETKPAPLSLGRAPTLLNVSANSFLSEFPQASPPDGPAPAAPTELEAPLGEGFKKTDVLAETIFAESPANDVDGSKPLLDFGAPPETAPALPPRPGDSATPPFSAVEHDEAPSAVESGFFADAPSGTGRTVVPDPGAPGAGEVLTQEEMLDAMGLPSGRRTALRVLGGAATVVLVAVGLWKAGLLPRRNRVLPPAPVVVANPSPPPGTTTLPPVELPRAGGIETARASGLPTTPETAAPAEALPRGEPTGQPVSKTEQPSPKDPPPRAEHRAEPAAEKQAAAPRPSTGIVAAVPQGNPKDLCRTAHDKGKYRDIVASCGRAAESSPPDAEAMVFLAQAELDHGRASAALNWAKKALSVDGTQADAYVYLGGAQQEAGRSQEAKAAYKKYLELAPQGRYAHDLRAIIETL